MSEPSELFSQRTSLGADHILTHCAGGRTEASRMKQRWESWCGECASKSPNMSCHHDFIIDSFA